MRFFSFLLLMFTFCPKTNNAQKNQTGKYAITTQPLQFLCRDVPITFERIYPKHTLGFSLGYRFDSRSYENPVGIIRYIAGSEREFTSPRFKGITLGVNSKIFLDKQRIFYLDGHLFYRYWWFDNREYESGFSNGGASYRYITSAQTNVFGAKLLFGMKESFLKRRIKRPFCYYYIGLGYRFKSGTEAGQRGITNYGTSTSDYGAYANNSGKRTPTIHLGFNFGIEFFKKNKVTE